MYYIFLIWYTDDSILEISNHNYYKKTLFSNIRTLVEKNTFLNISAPVQRENGK